MFNAPTKEQLSRLPDQFATENTKFEDKLVYLHFTIDRCHWWVMEFDGDDTFFGYVMLNGWHQDAELGYFRLSELLAVKLAGIIEVECEPHWLIRPAKDVRLIQEILDLKLSANKRIANL